MASQKFEITNPQALEFIAKFKSGQLTAPIKQKIYLYRWHIVGFVVLFSLFIAISIGKSLSQKSVPTFTPPELDNIAPTKAVTNTSVFTGLKKKLQEIQTMPDPALPVLNNKIDLEPVQN